MALAACLQQVLCSRFRQQLKADVRPQRQRKMNMDAPHFQSAHPTDYLRSLKAACEWMSIDLGRATQYRNLVREFFAEDKRSREHILAYNESCEIIDIYELWEAYTHHFPGLTQKVKAALSSGPSLREDERPETSNNRPRNDAFVYLVAGKLIRAGVKIITRVVP